MRTYCDREGYALVSDLTPDAIRRFLLSLEETGHNPGGVHANYRAVRAFLRWYEDECEPENWKNPIRKVRAPKYPEVVIDPIEVETIQALVNVCGRDFCGLRDRALIYFLFDTGARAGEVCALNIEDVDQIGGGVLIRQGKGRKPRTVFMGRVTRRAVRAYLKARLRDRCPALWTTDEWERLKYPGLRQIIRRRSEAANVPTPALHDFRRGFALNMLRNGVDLITLARLMGHTTFTVLRRYLRQVDEDLKAAHMRGSPVDHMDEGR